MKILREESYQSTPTLWPGEEDLQSPDGKDDPWVEKDSVVIQLQDSGPYNNKLIVRLKGGSETIEQYQFEVLSDEYRICRPEDEDIPIIILHYVAEFGYYVEGSENGPWGQYEYLIDAAGRFQERAQQADSPVTNYLFRIVSSQVELLCVKLASESKLNDEKYDLEALEQGTEADSTEEAEFIHGTVQLNKLPLSDSTIIPEQLKEFDLTSEIVRPNEGLHGVDVNHYYEEHHGTIAVIVTLPWGMKYFKFDGEVNGKCTLEFTGREELPGIFIEEYLKNEANAEVMNIPRVRASDSNLEMLRNCRMLLDNIRETEGIKNSSSMDWLETTELRINLSEMYLSLQESVGEEQFLQVLDDVLSERTDDLRVDDLREASFEQSETIVVLLGLAARQLDADEKQEASAYIERKNLDEVDTDVISIEEYTEYLAKKL
ncbi:hypothetical protein [Halorubrum pallidum]|uniref:DUF4365 domain-containing protein n=1 Tax=Halorubrum pallidum TaxID=1526114 RepID=A0ABD5SZV6_9EURY